MKINPLAIVLWAFCALVGFLSFGTLYAAACGLAIGLAMTIVAEIID